MKLEQLTAGTSISLIIHINEETLTFSSAIQELYPKKRFLLADPVFQNDKIVTFKMENIRVDMLVTANDEKPQLFENVQITAMKKPDNSFCYTIVTPTDGKPVNRRTNFRCYVGNRTTIKRGMEQEQFDAILRDVSTTGFSITTDSDIGFETGQIIHALLEDYIEELDENFSFHLYGMIVRTQKLENGKIVYGCRLSTHIGGLENYVTKKQRVQLRKNGGTKR